MDLKASPNPLDIVDEPYDLFDLSLDDAKLKQLCVDNLEQDVSHWKQKPWDLETTDKENIAYMLGDQLDTQYLLPHNTPYIDNRLHTSVRAILAYVTGRQAQPNLVPSKNDDKSIRVAKQLEAAVYQHGVNHNINDQFRLAVKNLIVRKRGAIKLRYDENEGPYGDIISESIDPADLVIDRFARYGQDPNRIYHKQKCTVEELIAKFPDKEAQIKQFFSIVQGRFTQMSRMITYWECWFSYYDQNKKKQGVCWFLPNANFVLGKMDNPNWLSKGSDKQQRIVNMTAFPPKPFVWFNYLNTGRSYIDETSLFDQAKPQQDLVNKRGRQIWENADYAVPRLLVNGKVMDEADAIKFVNKNPKTIGMLNKMDADANINNSVFKVEASALPSYVVSTLYDARNEIDTMMGTPSQFRGDQSASGSKNPTLGQDLLQKQQAGALQDDLVEVVNKAYSQYYVLLIQMMKVLLPDDYWVLTKGKDGEYASILLNSDSIDTNVRVGVEMDSTLPLNKEAQRQVALELAKAGRIDDLSLFEMLGLPQADKLADRLQKFKLDPWGYKDSVQQQQFNAEADSDITLLLANRVPEDRDNYSEAYLNHFNTFLTSNRFQQLRPDEQSRLTDFLHQVANKAATTQAMSDAMLDPSGMQTVTHLPAPIPKVQIRAQAEPGTAEQLLHMQQPPNQAANGQAGAIASQTKTSNLNNPANPMNQANPAAPSNAHP